MLWWSLVRVVFFHVVSPCLCCWVKSSVKSNHDASLENHTFARFKGFGNFLFMVGELYGEIDCFFIQIESVFWKRLMLKTSVVSFFKPFLLLQLGGQICAERYQTRLSEKREHRTTLCQDHLLSDGTFFFFHPTSDQQRIDAIAFLDPKKWGQRRHGTLGS